jgi:hypothetical protein
MIRKNIRTYLEAIVICFLVFLLIKEVTNKRKINTLEAEINRLYSKSIDKNTSINSKQDSIKELKKSFLKLKNDYPRLKLFEISEHEVSKLQKKGYKDPKKDFLDNLIQQKNLIPYEGILGGTMRIHDCLILNKKWVIACFDDGHIGGELLLEYSIKNNYVIEWKRIGAYLDGD